MKGFPTTATTNQGTSSPMEFVRLTAETVRKADGFG